ncbi:MAG: hypothetical protein COB15_10545 [Flavobacteriales bacterium]|nr:MAG: hypothetical protein COB15_10545 [Flavobacteriales bacterium]
MNFFSPNTDDLEGFFNKAKYAMAWRLSIAFISVFLILSVIFITSDIRIFSVFLIILIASLVCFIYLRKSKNFKVLFWIYVICGTILVHYSINYIYEFTHFVDFLWIIATVLLAFVGLGKKVGYVFIVINTLGIYYFFLFSLNKHIELLDERTLTQLIEAIVEITFAIAIISYLLHQYIVFNDYFTYKLTNANTTLTNKNEENIILVKEIHHRVKNNLQIVISLLRLQKHELDSVESRTHFSEAINRIMAMALIHKKLYQQSDMAEIQIEAYLNDLSEDLISISNMGLPIGFSVKSEVNKIGLKTIVPLGLLINELLSNSIKHAFSKKAKGFISINILKSNTNEFKLVYSDDGNWIEPKKNYTGFGLGLIQTLVEQLEGNFTRNKSAYTFTIKNIDI